MTAGISCTSNTMLDRNRPSIGGDRWFGIFVSTALANDQSTSTVNLHILMSPLINICPFWEYRHSKWQHWSFVHRILCLIKIGLKLLVGERRFGILVATAATDHKHPKILLILMPPLINICSLWEYRHCSWRFWSRVHLILCLIEIGLKLVEKDGWFGILVMQQSTRTEIVRILMTNLINICRHWSRVHRILF